MPCPSLYNIAAILGALFFGELSQRIGRRHAGMLALVVSLISIPAWAFGGTLGILICGSCLMQSGVQGAFGVIPAHLNELSPDAVRSLFSGFAYQLGVLVAAKATTAEFKLQTHFGYPWAFTMFVVAVIVSMLFIFGFGPEARDRNFRPHHLICHAEAQRRESAVAVDLSVALAHSCKLTALRIMFFSCCAWVPPCLASETVASFAQASHRLPLLTTNSVPHS